MRIRPYYDYKVFLINHVCVQKMCMMSCTRSRLYYGIPYAGETSSSYVSDWQLNQKGNIYSKLTSEIIYLDQ